MQGGGIRLKKVKEDSRKFKEVQLLFLFTQCFIISEKTLKGK